MAGSVRVVTYRFDKDCRTTAGCLGTTGGVHLQQRDSRLTVRLALAATIALAASAQAGFSAAPAAAVEPYTLTDQPFWAMSEVRVGAFDHALEDSRDERGAALNLEVLGSRFAGGYENGILNFLLTPRPHLGTTISPGKTDEFYWGVTWDARLFQRTFFETSFGGAAHNGPLDTPGQADYGCEVNFRESASLGYEVAPQWRGTTSTPTGPAGGPSCVSVPRRNG